MLTPLHDVRDLKTDRLAALLRAGAPAHIVYGQESDTLRVMFVPPETETFVHYLEDEAALIVDSADAEVVGFHIEDFQARFLPAHAGVQRAWRLSDTDISRAANFGDFILQFERAKRQAAREIVNATREVVLEKHREMNIPAYA